MADFSDRIAGPIAGGMFGSETHTGPFEILMSGLRRFLAPILELVYAGITADRTGQQWRSFQEAVERQIAGGLSINEARTRVAMDMYDNNPDFAEARAEYKRLAKDLPAEFRDQSKLILGMARGDVEGLESALAGVTEGYRQRESDVMAELGVQGEAAQADIERAYGEARGEALASRASRGLEVGGVGASLAGGFNTRRGEAQARSREEFARLKADRLSQLRGDTLDSSFTQATEGFGARTGLTNRREQALRDALGLDADLTGQYADWLYGFGQDAMGTFLDTTGDYGDFVENVTQYPPDTSHLGPITSSAFDSLNVALN
jgi:hypothetical protein